MQLRGISSMATKAVLLALCARYTELHGVDVSIESVGGVDATMRVQAGESFDLVMLGSDAIDKLIAGDFLSMESKTDWVKSPTSVAVRSGMQRPNLANAESLKQALLAAHTISFSTGPSGVYLEKLFKQWGVWEAIAPRLVTPPPGTPVASLIARGEVEIGFQQRSELLGVAGVEIVGDLPPDCAFITTFSSGIPVALADAAKRQAAQQFLNFLASPEAESGKRSHGMFWS